MVLDQEKKKSIAQFNKRIRWYWQNYLNAKDLSEPKYEFLIKKHKNAGTKHLSDPNAFIEYSNTMDDVYENIDDYNTNSQKKKN